MKKGKNFFKKIKMKEEEEEEEESIQLEKLGYKVRKRRIMKEKSQKERGNEKKNLVNKIK